MMIASVPMTIVDAAPTAVMVFSASARNHTPNVMAPIETAIYPKIAPNA